MALNSCTECGYEMEPLATRCPKCTRVAPLIAKVPCPHCGELNSKQAQECAMCGEALPQAGSLAVSGAVNASPVVASKVTKLPLKEYQDRATELGRRGELVRAIFILKEAVEFYPDDVPTRNVLIGLLDREGRTAEANLQRQELITAQMRTSEEFCVQQSWAAMNASDFVRARDLFERSIALHPNSHILHEGMARISELTGDHTRAYSERSLAIGLKSHRDLQVRNANAANTQSTTALEATGIVAGTAVGATGAAVGGGITLTSIFMGGLTMLAGVACCVIGALLCLTCIGIILGLPLIVLGLNLFGFGLAALMGGAAVGVGVGVTGLFTGGLMSGGALLARKYRREKK